MQKPLLPAGVKTDQSVSLRMTRSVTHICQSLIEPGKAGTTCCLHTYHLYPAHKCCDQVVKDRMLVFRGPIRRTSARPKRCTDDPGYHGQVNAEGTSPSAGPSDFVSNLYPVSSSVRLTLEGRTTATRSVTHGWLLSIFETMTLLVRKALALNGPPACDYAWSTLDRIMSETE